MTNLRARRLLGVALLSVGLGPAAFAANLIDNGDFDNIGKVYVSNTPQNGDDLATSGGTRVPGWTSVSGAAKALWIQAANGYQLTASPGNASGYFLDLTGQNNSKPYGGLEQRIVTVAGAGYTLTFAMGASTLYNTSGSGAAALTASATGTALLASHLYTLSPTSSNEWFTQTLTFVADSDETTIEFLADSNYTSQYTGLDNVHLVTRPLATTTTLSASPATAAPGASIALTALVKPSEGSATPKGTVQFKSGTQVLGSAAVNGAGQATYATTALAVGVDTITAAYSGDSIHAASVSTARTVTISASGPKVTLSAASLVFAGQAAATSSAAKSVQITNSGTSTLTLSSITVTGPQADDFILSKTCGSTLAAKATCSAAIVFKPVSSGTKTAAMTFVDNAGGSPQTVALSGTGTAGGPATLTLNPSSLVFGSQAHGTSSSAKTIMITNSGNATVNFSSIALTGAEADDFVLSKTCAAALAAQASCTLSVAFKPVSTGAKSAGIGITDTAAGSPQTVALTGTGT